MEEELRQESGQNGDMLVHNDFHMHQASRNYELLDETWLCNGYFIIS